MRLIWYCSVAVLFLGVLSTTAIAEDCWVECYYTVPAGTQLYFPGTEHCCTFSQGVATRMTGSCSQYGPPGLRCDPGDVYLDDFAPLLFPYGPPVTEVGKRLATATADVLVVTQEEECICSGSYPSYLACQCEQGETRTEETNLCTDCP